MFKIGVPMMQNMMMVQTIWTNALCTRGCEYDD